MRSALCYQLLWRRTEICQSPVARIFNPPLLIGGSRLLPSHIALLPHHPDTSKVLECYVDANFAGGWQEANAEDADNVMSRTGMVIMYANFSIFWRSSLQTEIVLSTAEAEYIALSSALRQVLTLMTMTEEINEVFPLLISKPNFVCKVHEYNQ